MQAAISTREAWLRYSRRSSWALSGVNIDVPAGCLTALVGPNGAGKTSLNRLWLGLARPTRGSVRVFGVDPADRRGSSMALTAYVAQEVALYRGLTARQHLAYARSERGSFDVPGAARWLERAGVPMDRGTGRLSGGQRVQVALALAIGTAATTLILDEPLANLDPLARREVVVHLAEYARSRGAAVILSSHVVSDLEGGFEHVIVVGGGTIREAGGISQVIARYGVVDEPAIPSPTMAVSQYLTREGRTRTLVRAPGGSTPSLEDVVMGLLSAARADREHRGDPA